MSTMLLEEPLRDVDEVGFEVGGLSLRKVRRTTDRMGCNRFTVPDDIPRANNRIGLPFDPTFTGVVVEDEGPLSLFASPFFLFLLLFVASSSPSFNACGSNVAHIHSMHITLSPLSSSSPSSPPAPMERFWLVGPHLPIHFPPEEMSYILTVCDSRDEGGERTAEYLADSERLEDEDGCGGENFVRVDEVEVEEVVRGRLMGADERGRDLGFFGAMV